MVCESHSGKTCIMIQLFADTPSMIPDPSVITVLYQGLNVWLGTPLPESSPQRSPIAIQELWRFDPLLATPAAEDPERLFISSAFQHHLPCNVGAAQVPCA